MPISVPAIVISLDRSPDRLAHMEREFARVGMAFERFAGVDGLALPESVKPYFCDASGSIVSPLRPGEIGTYASHLAVWQRIAAGSYGPAALVCEDDISLPLDLAQLLDRLSRARGGWDIMRLSSPTTRSVAVLAHLGNGRQLIRYWNIPPLAGAYMISRAGAGKLLKPGLRIRAVDNDMAHPWLFGLDAYGVLPPPVLQDTDASSSIAEQMGGRSSPRTRKAGRFLYNLRTMGLARWLKCWVREHARRVGFELA